MDLEIPDLSRPPTAEGLGGEGVAVTDQAFQRLAEIAETAGTPQILRVAVLGGGCSGFQYEFSLIDEPAPEDTVIEGGDQRVVVDPESLPFLGGSVVDFKDELIGARFAVDNPNAQATCGCGVSFSL